ncbi:MAG: hypothetical protein DWQ44_04855 [Bacteroidetes bacterium]|nr:MAG: hypothetical protein DWQ33_10935 [Bacteroidota bacterium]REK00605.1 MAG: hypothetical protein DWQ39_10610 [Bacteroidota bacterium]REK35273.1 MAG: hypothetical protein DWQ44_04855 [Bacteroidota bacterium]REK48349.1 MAG: hypothetical protein DWQ48_11055 [Bacteroidota bacterium]
MGIAELTYDLSDKMEFRNWSNIVKKLSVDFPFPELMPLLKFNETHISCQPEFSEGISNIPFTGKEVALSGKEIMSDDKGGMNVIFNVKPYSEKGINGNLEQLEKGVRTQ